MKRKLLLVLLLCGYFLPASAQFDFFQYFDGADTSITHSVMIYPDSSPGNVWQIGPPQKVIFDSAATLPNAIVTDTINTYPPDDTSRFIAKIYPGFGNFGIFAIQWKQKLDMDASFDGGIVEYSIDTGQSWINIMNNPFVYNFYGYDTTNLDTLPGGEFAFSGTDSTWKDIWVCFDYSWLLQFAPNDTLLFRFTLISDGIDNFKDGWMIDNIYAHRTILHTVRANVPENYLHVFPNPANDILHIELAKINDYHIIEEMELVDPMGREMDTWKNIPTKFWIKTDHYASGLYFLKVKSNIKTVTTTLSIQKH